MDEMECCLDMLKMLIEHIMMSVWKYGCESHSVSSVFDQGHREFPFGYLCESTVPELPGRNFREFL